MAIIFWRLSHINSERLVPPLRPFIVFRQNKVFDMDSLGRELGVIPDMPLSQLKWYYPHAQWVPWRDEDYKKTFRDITEWVRSRAMAWDYPEIRIGWWEYPRMTRKTLADLMTEVVPRWALHATVGVARHPVLAQWASEQGQIMALEKWSGDLEWDAYVVRPEQDQSFWNQLPVSYAPASEKERQYWARRGWTRISQVPGLLKKVQTFHATGEDYTGIRVIRTFEDGLRNNFANILSDMAEELLDQLKSQKYGMDNARLIWEHTGSVEHRERQWSTVIQDRHVLIARILALLHWPPQAPPERIMLDVQPRPLALEQVNLWGESRRSPSQNMSTVLERSRREALLQIWDVWRRPLSS